MKRNHGDEEKNYSKILKNIFISSPLKKRGSKFYKTAPNTNLDITSKITTQNTTERILGNKNDIILPVAITATKQENNKSQYTLYYLLQPTTTLKQNFTIYYQVISEPFRKQLAQLTIEDSSPLTIELQHTKSGNTHYTYNMEYYIH